MAPPRFGLDMDLASHEATMPQSTSASAVWMKKVEELANRGITIRQLVGFYADLIEATGRRKTAGWGSQWV